MAMEYSGGWTPRHSYREAPGDSVWSYRRHSAILFVLQLQPSHTISFRRKRSCSSNRIRERCPLLSQSAGFYRVLRQQRCGSSSSVKPIIVLCYARCKHLFSYIFSIVLQSPASNRKIRQQLSLLQGRKTSHSHQKPHQHAVFQRFALRAINAHSLP